MLNKFLSLHMLTINPTVSSGYSELYCQSGARSAASRKSGVAERSGERELQKNDGSEQSVEQEVAERQRSGERGYKNRLERGAGFFVAHMIWTLLIQYCVYGVVFLMCGTLGA